MIFARRSSVITNILSPAYLDRRLPRCLELRRHVRPEHFDLEAGVEFADVANFDALLEHRLAVAFGVAALKENV
jgi:hypothetical protein